LINDALDANSGNDHVPHSHPLDLDTRDADDAPPLTDADRPHRLKSHPIRNGEPVAHLSDYLHVFVTAFDDHEQGKAKEDIVVVPNAATLITASTHLHAGS
jgi:hypothetical protein